MAGDQDDSILTDGNIKSIHRKLLKSAKGLALSLGVPEKSIKEIVYSMTELGAALGEAKTDLSFVKQRRGVSSPSVGKVAGVLTFRLCRHNIFHLPPDLAEHEKFTSFKELAVLSYVIFDILKMDITNPWIRGGFIDEVASHATASEKTLPNIIRELRYMLTRRHYNQEILGVVYDAMRIVHQMSTKIDPAKVTSLERRKR